MKIRILWLIATALAAVSFCRAQETKTAASALTHATVFARGAELTHTATATLPRGTSELAIEGLPINVNPSSVKITATGGVVVTAYECTYVFGREQALSPQVKKMRDSLEMYNAAMQKLTSDQKINTAAAELLKKGIDKNVAGSDNGLGIDEFAKMMEYHKSKSDALYAEGVAIKNKYQQLLKEREGLSTRLSEAESQAGSAPGILKLSLSSPLAQSCKFAFTYQVSQASWRPRYDIVVADAGTPVAIAMKAAVSQRTGMNWDKVKLTLSTSMSGAHQAPVLDTWFLSSVKPKGVEIIASEGGEVVIAGRAVEHSVSEELAYQRAPENAKFSGRGVAGAQNTSNVQPLVLIDGRESTQSELSRIAPETIKSFDVLNDAQATARYGSRGANGVIQVTLKGTNDYVSVSDDAVWANYEVELPANVPSGKIRNIDLQTMQATAEYKYYCIPKLDPQVYLQAEIADWEKLGLLTGQASVTFNGTYVGSTWINPSSIEGKLPLTLGADKRIAVKREKLRDFSSTKTFGSNVTQVFTYQITVKNNQNKAVKMVVKDQYPISTMMGVEVVLSARDTTPWTDNNAETGTVTWEEELAPGQTKVYRLSYSVKYPKDTNLNL